MLRSRQLAEAVRRSAPKPVSRLQPILEEHDSSLRKLADQIEVLLERTEGMAASLNSYAEASQRDAETIARGLERTATDVHAIADRDSTISRESFARSYGQRPSAAPSPRVSGCKDKSFSPGRWAVGYPYLYVLYRALDEVQTAADPRTGPGQSTRMIAQYAAAHEDVDACGGRARPSMGRLLRAGLRAARHYAAAAAGVGLRVARGRGAGARLLGIRKSDGRPAVRPYLDRRSSRRRHGRIRAYRRARSTTGLSCALLRRYDGRLREAG